MTKITFNIWTLPLLWSHANVFGFSANQQLRVVTRLTTSTAFKSTGASTILHNTALFSASEDDAPGNSDQSSETHQSVSHDAKMEPKLEVPDPPPFVSKGYNLATVLNVASAIALACNYPDPSLSTASITSTTASTATGLTRYQPNLLPTYTAGTLGYLFLAGGSCNILAEAVRTKRLFTSDTYKRLTMGTLLFGLIGLWSVPGEIGCNSAFGAGVVSTLVLTQITKFVTAMVSFVGWEYSAGSFGASNNRANNIMKEIGKGCKNVWSTLPVSDERPATFYRTFFLLVTLFNPLCNIPELFFNLRQGVGLFSLSVSLNISSIARLGLLSVLLYVLKDAAERDRLDGTTFIKLNISVGLWALGVGIAQGIGQGEFNIRRAGDKLLFACLFLNNGIISLLQKMGVMSNDDPDSDPPLRVKLF